MKMLDIHRVILKIAALSIITSLLILFFMKNISSQDKYIIHVKISSAKPLFFASNAFIQKSIQPLVSYDSWYNTSTKDIENTIAKVNGFNNIIVKKKWPDTILINIKQGFPLAYWKNKKTILLKNKNIIENSHTNIENSLPIFNGNKKDKEIIYLKYKQLSSVISKLNIGIKKISLIDDQWEIVLQNNILIKLGSQNTLYRFKKIILVLKNIPNLEKIEYIDARYNNGFALKYIDKTLPKNKE